MDQKVFGLIDRVAAAERRLGWRLLAVVHPRTDVDRAAVIDHPDVHLLGRSCAFGGFLLDEVRDRHGFAPGRVIEVAVEADRAFGNANGRRLLASVLRRESNCQQGNK